MGDANIFLVSTLKFILRPDGNLSVQIYQQYFDKNTAARFSIKYYKRVTLMTP